METISRKDFELLCKHLKGEPFEVDYKTAERLVGLGYLELTNIPTSDPAALGLKYKVIVSENGIVACDHYGVDRKDLSQASFRSWLAIWLSFAALVISLLDFCINAADLL